MAKDFCSRSDAILSSRARRCSTNCLSTADSSPSAPHFKQVRPRQQLGLNFESSIGDAMLESAPRALLPGEKNSNDRDDMAVSPMVSLLTHQGSIFARICPNYYSHLGGIFCSVLAVATQASAAIRTRPAGIGRLRLPRPRPRATGSLRQLGWLPSFSLTHGPSLTRSQSGSHLDLNGRRIGSHWFAPAHNRTSTHKLAGGAGQGADAARNLESSQKLAICAKSSPAAP